VDKARGLTPEDLKHTVLQYGNARVTIFPTVTEDGFLEWNGSVTMPGQTLVLISAQESRAEALKTTLVALESFIGGLLGLAKAIMTLAKTLEGSGNGRKT
jgi:hypothetical protein